MRSIIKYALINSIRDYLFHGLLVLILLATAVAVFLGSTALVEENLMQLSYIAGAHRAILVIGMILFVSLQTRRLFENKEIESLVSLPYPRYYFVLSYIAAYAFICILLSIPTCLIVTLYHQGHIVALAVWIISLIAELVLMSIFALTASLVLNGSIQAILASFAFYFVARLTGFLSSVIDFNLPTSWEGLHIVISENVIKIISIVIPRIDLFTDTNWLIYGLKAGNDYRVVLGQAVIYGILLIIIANYDFKRKEF